MTANETNFYGKYIKQAITNIHFKNVTCKHFVKAGTNRTFSPPSFGPADFGNIIMFCQGVQMAIEVLQTNKMIESLLLFGNISL